MSAGERREQLIDVARTLFAERGYDATSIEEIAASAQVSKPVVYEHFGGKEGLYAVIIDRELTLIYSTIVNALESDPSPSAVVEHAALALLTYIEDNTDGFRIISSENDRSRGIVAMPAQWWLLDRTMTKEEVAAHMVNLAWNGLRGMEPDPVLRNQGDTA